MLLLFELPHQLVEALRDVVQLLFQQPCQLLLDLLDHLRIVLDQPLRIVYHLSQVDNILFNRVRYNKNYERRSLNEREICEMFLPISSTCMS